MKSLIRQFIAWYVLKYECGHFDVKRRGGAEQTCRIFSKWAHDNIVKRTLRYYGETTAKILRELSQINKPPINLFEHKRQGRMQRIYCEELMKIKEKLDDAGVRTRQVRLREGDIYK